MPRAISRAIAIAAVKENSLTVFCHRILYFMYGTPERTRLTYRFAMWLAILGCTMQLLSPDAQVCSIDTLGLAN